MDGRTHVLIRYWVTERQGPTDGHSPTEQQGPKLTRVNLSALSAYMGGRDIRRYQYAAGSHWHDFAQADTRLMRGEVEARMQQARADFSRRQQAPREEEVIA